MIFRFIESKKLDAKSVLYVEILAFDKLQLLILIQYAGLGNLLHLWNQF